MSDFRFAGGFDARYDTGADWQYPDNTTYNRYQSGKDTRYEGDYGGAVLFRDFVTMTSLPGSFTFTRASKAWDERFVSYSDNVPRLRYGFGLLIEEARTNKQTADNAAITSTAQLTKGGDAAATLTVVDDAARLTQYDSATKNANVYQLDNTGGSSDAWAEFPGTAANTNTHIGSIYAAGLGQAELVLGAQQPGTTDMTPSYKRVSQRYTSTTATDTLKVHAKAGAIVRFFGQQLEEGAQVTSPIVTSGVAATRAAEVCNESAQRTGAFSFQVQAQREAFNQGQLQALNRWITFYDVPTLTNALEVQSDTTQAARLRYRVRIAGVDSQIETGTLDVSNSARITGLSAANNHQFFVGSVKDQTLTTPPVMPQTERIGYGYKVDSDTGQINGYVMRATVWNRIIGLVPSS